MSEVKQVIVWRGNLKCRKGKMMAQAAHASLGAVLSCMNKSERTDFVPTETRGYWPVKKYGRHMEFEAGSFWDAWLNGRFTKICVSCEDEKELLLLHETAKNKGIPTVLITDAGLTEFHGEATNTCIAIGPYWSEEIDKITGHLKLL
jgi:PTH2 family peptidyl-tRNA hydrolase